jgi:hypothetical protein
MLSEVMKSHWRGRLDWWAIWVEIRTSSAVGDDRDFLFNHVWFSYPDIYLYGWELDSVAQVGMKSDQIRIRKGDIGIINKVPQGRDLRLARGVRTGGTRLMTLCLIVK